MNKLLENSRGLFLYNAKEFQSALDVFNAILKEDSEYEAALINKGLCLQAMKRYDESIQCYKKVIEISDVIKNRQPTDLYFFLGLSYYYNNDFENSIEAFSKDLTININNLETLNFLGLSYLNKGDLITASEKFDSLLLFNPQDINGLNNKGISLLEQGKYKESIEYFDKASALNRNFTGPIFNKALALNGIGKKRDAITLLEKVLVLAPKHKDAAKKIEEIEKELIK